MERITFEYKSIYTSRHELPAGRVVDFLNEMGQEGWELVQINTTHLKEEPLIVGSYLFYFKRRL